MEFWAIVGSRKYPNLNEVRVFVNALPAHTIVVSGGATGVDLTAENAARDRGLVTVCVRPGIKITMHRGEIAHAYYERNAIIAQIATRMTAFMVTERSGGTQNAIEQMIALGKPVEVRRP